MHVTVIYMGQIKGAAGMASEGFDLPDGSTLHALIARVVTAHGELLRGLLLDDAGALRPSLLLSVNGRQLRRNHPAVLYDGDEVLVMTPIAGG